MEAEDPPHKSAYLSVDFQGNSDTNINSAKPAPSAEYTPSRVNILRLFRLQALGQIKALRASTERRKIAVYESRRIAVWHALLHLVPLGAAMTLLVLYWKQVFVGISFTDAAALQFLAKLHELLMQASIAEVVLCIIRTQVLHGYIPLGALSASIQALHISYIWSLEFLSASMSRAFYGWRKLIFIILVPCLIFLAALVGPSSAALMIPRLGSVQQLTMDDPYVYANASLTDLFPSHVDGTHNLTFNARQFLTSYPLTYSYKSQRLVTQSYYNRDGVDTSDSVTRELRYYTLGVEPQGEHGWAPGTSIATMPTQISARILHKPAVALGSPEVFGLQLRFVDKQHTLSVSIPRPVVVATCGGYESQIQKITPNLTITYIHDDRQSRGILMSFTQLIQQYISDTGSEDTLVNSLPPIWRASPQVGSSSIVGVFIRDECTSPQYRISDFLTGRLELPDRGSCLTYNTCTISASWQSTRHELTRNNGMIVLRSAPLPDLELGTPNDFRPITMTLDEIPAFNTADFTDIVHSAVSTHIVQTAESLVDYVYLAAGFASALSEISIMKPIAYETRVLPGWSSTTRFDIIHTQSGYGYGTSSTSLKLSIAIITAYCMVTIGYIAYILVTGHTSTAWNSAMELVVLALQSRSPDHLGHASVGINSMETYKEAVGIRVSDNDELELVFAHDRDTRSRNLRTVVPNKAY